MFSRVPASGPGEQVGWPVRSGSMPPLADTFSSRPETAPRLGAALVPGAVVVLAPEQAAAGRARTWLGSCGKTQLAVSAAHSLRQSGSIDLLVWVPATNRASVLAGYVQAAAAAMGIRADADAESIATRFVRWLAGTERPWLVVFDDLTDAADSGRPLAGGQGQDPGHDRRSRDREPGAPAGGSPGRAFQSPGGDELPDGPGSPRTRTSGWAR